jgi:hypothetical protein
MRIPPLMEFYSVPKAEDSEEALEFKTILKKLNLDFYIESIESYENNLKKQVSLWRISQKPKKPNTLNTYLIFTSGHILLFCDNTVSRISAKEFKEKYVIITDEMLEQTIGEESNEVSKNTADRRSFACA